MKPAPAKERARGTSLTIVSALLLQAQQRLLDLAELVFQNLRGRAFHDPAPHQRFVMCDAFLGFADSPAWLICVVGLGHGSLLPRLSDRRTKSYASPARHFSVDLHRRQMRSPAQALGNAILQTRQLRVLASASSVSGVL